MKSVLIATLLLAVGCGSPKTDEANSRSTPAAQTKVSQAAPAAEQGFALNDPLQTLQTVLSNYNTYISGVGTQIASLNQKFDTIKQGLVGLDPKAAAEYMKCQDANVQAIKAEISRLKGLLASLTAAATTVRNQIWLYQQQMAACSSSAMYYYYQKISACAANVAASAATAASAASSALISIVPLVAPKLMLDECILNGNLHDPDQPRQVL